MSDDFQVQRTRPELHRETQRVAEDLVKELRRARVNNGAGRIEMAMQMLDAVSPAALYRFIDPSAIEAEAGARWDRQGKALEATRNIVAIAPLVFTWLALTWAAIAYQQTLVQNPSLSSQPFLVLWQQGFGGRMPLDFMVTAIIAATLVVFTVVAFLVVEVDHRATPRAVARLSAHVSTLTRAIIAAADGKELRSFERGASSEEWGRSAQYLLDKVAHSVDKARANGAEMVDISSQINRTVEAIRSDQETLGKSLDSQVSLFMARSSTMANAAGQMATTTETIGNQMASLSTTINRLHETVQQMEGLLSRQFAQNAATQQAADQEQPHPSIERLRFTGFSPARPPVATPQKLVVYAHVEAALQAVRNNAAKVMGPSSEPRQELTIAASRALARGVELTIVPECDGVTFDREYASFRWLQSWHKTEFTFTCRPELAGQRRVCRITFLAGPLIVGKLEMPLEFVEASPTNVASQNQVPREVTSDLYRRIFVSYSHEDTPVVLACRNAYMALGDVILIDRDTLRSGQRFDDALKLMIEEAEIFQLFWSERSARSRYVRREWQHALLQNKGDAYVRPVYWEKPMIPPPDELKDLHFTYVRLPELDDANEFTSRRRNRQRGFSWFGWGGKRAG